MNDSALFEQNNENPQRKWNKPVYDHFINLQSSILKSTGNSLKLDEKLKSACLVSFVYHARFAIGVLLFCMFVDSLLTSFRDVPAQDFINAYAQFLQRQGKLDVPGYVDIVKTSSHNELPPQEAETWFYKRAASAARQIYLKQNIGVGNLNRKYGGAKNRGCRSGRHTDASGSVNRKALQALEKLGVVELSPKGGRRITPNGQRDLDRIAAHTLQEEDDE